MIISELDDNLLKYNLFNDVFLITNYYLTDRLMK